MAFYGWDQEYTMLPTGLDLTGRFLADYQGIVFQNADYIIVDMP
jgi:hypothetical protein